MTVYTLVESDTTAGREDLIPRNESLTLRLHFFSLQEFKKQHAVSALQLTSCGGARNAFLSLHM